MSPVRSITTAASRSRTAACSSCVAITASFQAQDELQRASAAFAGHARLVDHLLDQEQAPAARLLAALELGLDVRCLRLGRLGRVATVGDLYTQTVGAVEDAD